MRSRWHSWGIDPKLSRDAWRQKRGKEKWEPWRPEWECPVHRCWREVGRQTVSKHKRATGFPETGDHLLQETCASKWAVRLPEPGGRQRCPVCRAELERCSLSHRGPSWCSESVCSSWRHRPCCYLLWISQFQLFTHKTWLCFSHFHRLLLHREQKEPASRLGMFLLLQEVGPALPFTRAPSALPVTCSISGPPRPTESEHQFLQAVRGFCLQSVIWEMLMECLTSLLASNP